MGKIAHFRILLKENSSWIPAYWIYQHINPIFKLLSAIQIALNNCMSVKLELLLFIAIKIIMFYCRSLSYNELRQIQHKIFGDVSSLIYL